MTHEPPVSSPTPGVHPRVETDRLDGRFPIALACPDCGSTLPSNRSEPCGGCGASWPRRGGIDVLSRSDEYWGEIPRERVAGLLDAAERDGWRAAIRTGLDASESELAWYISSQARADFRFLLPLGPQSVVLDAGAGWGTLSIPLAGAARWVVSLEGVAERIRFIEIRARQEHVHNLQLVQGDAFEPPFPPESFDIVVANGLLEWVGLHRDELHPREAQQRFLQHVRRVLRPGGALYIGIENRFGRGQWRGDIDHTGFRFTSLMPRRLADHYVNMRRARGAGLEYRAHGAGRGYRTWTYSPAGYATLLEEAGFTDVRIWTSIEGYNDPHRLVPLSSGPASRYFYRRLNRPRSAVTRAARRLGGHAWWRLELRLRRWTAPSVLLVARRPEASP